MKKTKIEKFIFENKEEFNQLRAPSDMWDKIEEKLPPAAEKKSSARIMMMNVIKIAAISIGLLTSGVMIGKMYFSKNNLRMDAEVSQTIEKTENYYGTMIHFKLDEAKKQDLLDDKLMQHLDELDKEYRDLKLKMSQAGNQNNEFLVNQMVKNYKLRLSLIELLLDRGKIKGLTNNNLSTKDTI